MRWRQLEQIEDLSRTLLDQQAGASSGDLRVARIPADCAAWRRAIAATLVGMRSVDTPPPGHPRRSGAAAPPWKRPWRGPANRPPPWPATCAAQAWDEATQAFVAFEAAVAEARTAAAAA